MDIDDRAFVVGNTAVEWGITLVEVRSLMPMSDALELHSGFRNERCVLHYPCVEAYGVSVERVELGAPAPDRPVMVARYHLAPPGSLSGPMNVRSWRRELVGRLGDPAEEYESRISPEADGCRHALYTASWTLGAVKVVHRVSGDHRHASRSSASLGLEWADKSMAARPYLAQGEKSEKQLERLSKRARGVRFFDLQRVQPAPLLYDVQDDESMRRCKRVLYCPSVIPTPAHIKKQLNSYQVALWSVAGRDEWALSTSMETTLLGRGKDTELRWRLETWDEGRGEDYMTLDIGVCFRLEAHASSKPFRSLVRSLGEVTGREIVCCVSYHS